MSLDMKSLRPTCAAGELHQRVVDVLARRCAHAHKRVPVIFAIMAAMLGTPQLAANFVNLGLGLDPEPTSASTPSFILAALRR